MDKNTFWGLFLILVILVGSTYLMKPSEEELKKEQKDNNLSEDDLKKNSNEVQKITDLKIAEIDKKLSEKEVEILKV